MRFTMAALLCCFLLVSGALPAQELPALIPKPSKMTAGKGAFTFSSSTAIVVEHGAARAEALAALAAEGVKSATGILPAVRSSKHLSAERDAVVLKKSPRLANLGPEGYAMTVGDSVIRIEAPAEAGLWYGLQTLLQLLPPGGAERIRIPGLAIEDKPRFAWRGMHLDVCRHFFPASFVKKYIDYLAMYKMNTFHWHLTDDQGWRIEIKKYPKLTEVAAWRSGTMVGPYSAQRYDSVRYGGFYTQDEIREIVAYAQARHVTVVPEIEMPGHALAALAAYPELSCTGGPFEVAKGWGVFEDVFCPKETTFAFLQNVLAEVCGLFPGKYIHIGGDECPKERWKTCASCRALMKRLRLKDEHQLQSYFIRRIEKFVNRQGKRIIGWDEILEGGLAPNAAVMSWRGIDGGIAAARKNHYVVMTPGSHCYFDYYQGNPDFEPLAIGGYTTVEKVYSYDPIPAKLPRSKAKYILGAQGNLWTEYIASEKHVEYMAMPRMAALAEVLWSPNKGRAYAEFQDRLLRHFPLLDAKGVNYSRSIYQIKATVDPIPGANGVALTLSSPFGDAGIRYTTDGSSPSASSARYAGPIPVTASTRVRFCYVKGDDILGPVAELPFLISKSTGKPVRLKTPPHENYTGDGPSTLVNGIRGNPVRHGLHWIGFWGPDLEAVIDLERPTQFTKVSMNFFDGEGSWIYLPKHLEVLVSENGESYASVKRLSADEIRRQGGAIILDVGAQSARYVKVIAENAGKIPPGKQGAGSAAWLFIDEIMIE
jgi:hexosaminidase